MEEFVSAARVLNVLDPDVDSLFDVAVADLLVTYYADRGLGNVVDDASLAVVDFVRHAYVRVSHVLLSDAVIWVACLSAKRHL